MAIWSWDSVLIAPAGAYKCYCKHASFSVFRRENTEHKQEKDKRNQTINLRLLTV